MLEHDPDFVLLRQARREMQSSVLDVSSARSWLDALPGQIVRCRHLVAPSPLTSSWTQPAIGPVEEMDTREDVLKRLHAELMGQG